MLIDIPQGKIISFAYDSLPPEVAKNTKSAAIRIKKALKTTSVEIGNELRQVKASLNHGQFIAWLKAEFGMSPRTAQRCMAVAEFAAKNAKLLHLPNSALQALAAPSTPEGAREEVIAMSATGKKVKVKAVRKIINKWKNRADKPKKAANGQY